ncbi:MAG: hypothetical protein J7M40_02045 [Planctomycetes bacterium]|nr:hypothetical protein [Planctomycetota bacterium]
MRSVVSTHVNLCLLISVLFALGVCLGSALIIWLFKVETCEFSKAAWQSATASGDFSARYKMVWDLLEREKLDGLSEKAVVELLEEPTWIDKTKYDKVQYYVYNLGNSDSYGMGYSLWVKLVCGRVLSSGVWEND